MNSSPIGIFDSGIGGLTVARAVYERLPYESTVYFGDTARVPYGPKSPETVRRYSIEILDWLLSQGSGSGLVARPVFKTATEAPSAAPVGPIPTRSRHQPLAPPCSGIAF